MVVVGVVSALNAFVEVYAMTAGGPSVDVGGRAYGSTWVTGYYLFDTFYVKLKLGYAGCHVLHPAGNSCRSVGGKHEDLEPKTEY